MNQEELTDSNLNDIGEFVDLPFVTNPNIDEDDQELQGNDSEGGDDLYEHHRFVTDKGQSLVRLDKFLFDRLSKVSRSKLQDAIRAGSIKVNDKEVKPNHRVHPFQTITIALPHPPHEDFVEPQDIPLNIVYEDDDVMVINKPAGMVVHPGLGNPDNTLVNALAWHFKGLDLPVKAGNSPNRPGLVHRIDKDTSGLMVIAKNQYAMTHLAKQFFYHTIERRYWALVWGQPDDLEGTIDVNIGRNPRDPMQIIAFHDGDDGKNAITHYKVLEPMYYVSLVECKLETGRTHQIRVHMKSKGHPLFQDARYGGNLIVKGTIYTKYKQFVNNIFKTISRQALHAKTIGFEHPTTGEFMRFESELPTDFDTALKTWRHYLNSRRGVELK